MCVHREFRCCMCPNTHDDEESMSCPSGAFKKEVSSCEFVKMYMDDRGWKYKVMRGLGEEKFKARYQKPDKKGLVGWKGLRTLPWRGSFDEAQKDLNILAKEKGWRALES